MPAPAPNLPPVLLPRKEVLRRIALGNTSLWIMCKSGHFPQPVILNPHARFPKLAWREAEVSQWINSREKGIGAGPPGTAYERRTALAQQRLTAGVAGDQFPSAREPVTATRPLTRAERLALVGGITVTEE